MRSLWPTIAAVTCLSACGPGEATPAAAPVTPPPPAEPAASAAPAPPPAPPAAPLRSEDLLLALGALNKLIEVGEEARADTVKQCLEVTAKLAASARPEDRALLEQGLAVQRELARYELGQPLDRSVFDRLVAIDRAWAALYPSEPWPGLWLGRTLRGSMASLMFRPFDPAQADRDRAEGTEILKALAERYPDNVYVVTERADICAGEREELVDCMRRYQRCLALAPGWQRCAVMLEDVRGRYTAPFCAPADMKRGFEIRIASARKGATVSWPVDPAKLDLGPPILRAADVEEIASAPLPKGEQVVKVRVMPGKRAEMKDVRSALGKKRDAYLVFLVGGQRVAGMKADDILDDGSTVGWWKGAKIDRICARTSRRTLPPDPPR